MSKLLTPKQLAEIRDRWISDDIDMTEGIMVEADPADYFDFVASLFDHITALEDKLEAAIIELNGECLEHACTETKLKAAEKDNFLLHTHWREMTERAEKAESQLVQATQIDWQAYIDKLEATITALEAQRLGFRKGCEELIDKWRQIYFIDNNQHGLVSGDTTYANDLDELLKQEQES